MSSHACFPGLTDFFTPPPRQGFAAAKSFVHAHFLSRLLPTSSTSLPSQTASASILPLLKFQNPTRILSLQLQSASLPRLTHKLLKESGRLSAHPTFIIGAYSGNVKLGEGFGSSLKMAEWRASEDALRRSYLGGGRLDVDGKGFPSQQWADGEFEGWNGGVSKWAEGKSFPLFYHDFHVLNYSIMCSCVLS